MNWQSHRNGWRFVAENGLIVGRVAECSYPNWGEYSATDAQGKSLGIFASEGSAKVAVEKAAAPSSGDSPR